MIHKYLPSLLLCFITALPVVAQDMTPIEQENLQRALAEAGNSPVEFARAVENHLRLYPNSPKRNDLERALVKTAMDLNDDRRIGTYGESVLQRAPDDLQILERVTTALLHKGDKASAEKALIHANHFVKVVEGLYRLDSFQTGAGKDQAKRRDDFDRGMARGQLMVARCQGLLGHYDEAVQLAKSSYELFPSVEGARETAKWLAAAGKDQEAVSWYATVIAIAGIRSSDPDDVADRNKMGELYRKGHNGSDAGLGDVILKSYDATGAQFSARRERLRKIDPNIMIRDPLQYTLSGVAGDKLQLASLTGKVIVFDFWATWCGPCRVQHPLYEEVKEKFKNRDDVVFLSIDADEDHSQVKPFLDAEKWTQKVYFEDGLSNLLQVTSLPMTVVYGKKGDVVSKMPGFLPDRFVDMLADRINDALGLPPEPPKRAPTISQ